MADEQTATGDKDHTATATTATGTTTATDTAATTTDTTTAATDTTKTGTTTTDDKGATSTTTDSKAAETKVEAKAAPDKYELKVPDAGKAFVDAADLAYLETIARGAGWSNEDAQAALEEHVLTVAAQSQRFEAAAKADPDYGGAKFAESQRLAKSVIDRIRPDGHARREAFMGLLNRGAGNHVEVIAFLADLGKLMAEDRPAHARGTGGGRRDPVEVLYGSESKAS